jgi:hypothetical protein
MEDFNSTDTTVSLGSGDSIYVGTLWPIVDLFFNVTSGSSDGRATDVSYWDGNQFRSSGDLLDGTLSSGNSFGTDGHLSWIPDRDYSITRVSDPNEDISALSGIKVYNRYWYKISFSDAISFDIGWMGSLFCSHEDIDSEFPDLTRSDVMSAISAGKTDYLKQIVRASEIVIDDCLNRGKFTNEGEVLDRRELRLATVSKVAEIVYTLLDQEQGTPRLEQARQEYQSRISKVMRQIDTDGNRIASASENRPSIRILRR